MKHISTSTADFYGKEIDRLEQEAKYNKIELPTGFYRITVGGRVITIDENGTFNVKPLKE